MIRQRFPQTPEEHAAELERAQRIVDEAFPKHGTPRSDEFRAGCLAILQYFLAGQPFWCPGTPSSAQRDAFFAGVDAGKKIFCHWRDR